MQVKCPVCYSPHKGSGNQCKVCGFTELKIYPTDEDAKYCYDNVVIPYQEPWIKKTINESKKAKKELDDSRVIQNKYKNECHELEKSLKSEFFKYKKISEELKNEKAKYESKLKELKSEKHKNKTADEELKKEKEKYEKTLKEFDEEKSKHKATSEELQEKKLSYNNKCEELRKEKTRCNNIEKEHENTRKTLLITRIILIVFFVSALAFGIVYFVFKRDESINVNNPNLSEEMTIMSTSPTTSTVPTKKCAGQIAWDIFWDKEAEAKWGKGTAREKRLIDYGGEQFQKEVQDYFLEEYENKKIFKGTQIQCIECTKQNIYCEIGN